MPPPVPPEPIPITVDTSWAVEIYPIVPRPLTVEKRSPALIPAAVVLA